MTNPSPWNLLSTHLSTGCCLRCTIVSVGMFLLLQADNMSTFLWPQVCPGDIWWVDFSGRKTNMATLGGRNVKISPYTWNNVLTFQGHHWKIPQSKRLKNHKFIFLQFRRARSPRSRCWQQWFLPKPLSLTGRWVPSHCVLTWCLLFCVHICLSFKDPSQVGSETIIMVWFSFFLRSLASF